MSERTPAEVLQAQAEDVVARVMAGLTTRAPSKRAVKTRGGGSMRKQYNGAKWVSAVGGTTDLTKAIYADSETELCVTVDHRRGMRGGKPFRSPGQGARSAGAYRGQ
jgi:hypothetical protein